MGMKKNMVTLLGIAFVVAIVATGLFYGLVVTKLNSTAEANKGAIVVAVRDLKRGAVLSPEDVKLAPRGNGDALIAGFASEAQVAGLTLMEPVSANEPITREMLVSKGSPQGAALGIPPGLRAVSIHVFDSTGVVSLLQPGHRVDAQVVCTSGHKPGASTTLRTVLQNLEVLKVEANLETTLGRRPLPVVTLLASPHEADVLGLADAAAQIRLVLRHPLDDELTARASVALTGVMRKTSASKRPSSRTPTSSGPGLAVESDGKPVHAAASRRGLP